MKKIIQVFLLIERIDGDIVVTPHATLQEAEEGFKHSLKEYKEMRGWDLNINATNDIELYEASNGECTMTIDDRWMEIEV